MTIINFLFLIRAHGEIEPCLFVAYFLPCFLHQYPMLTLPSKGTYLSITWRSLVSSKGRRSGESEGVVKSLTGFSEATEIVAGSRYGVYWDILCWGWVLSSKVMGGRFKYGLPNSSVKGSLKKS